MGTVFDPMTLLRRHCATRLAVGVTQAQLAKRLGEPAAAIARDRASFRSASVREALIIAWELGMTVDALAGRWERPLMKAPTGAASTILTAQCFAIHDARQRGRVRC